MRSPTYMSDNTLVLTRLSLGWLTLCSLTSVMMAIALVQGQGSEPTDPIYYLMLLGPVAGWAVYFRGHLGSVFLLGLPPVLSGPSSSPPMSCRPSGSRLDVAALLRHLPRQDDQARSNRRDRSRGSPLSSAA